MRIRTGQVSLLFTRIDHERVLTELGPNKRSTEAPARTGLRALIGALKAFGLAYNKVGELLPEFTRICEDDIQSSARKQ